MEYQGNNNGVRNGGGETMKATENQAKSNDKANVSDADEATKNRKRPAEASSENTKKKQAKRVKRKHMDPKVLESRGKIQQCCKFNDLATALKTYRATIEQNIRIEPQIFYSLLNLCDGFDRSKVHVGTPKRTNGENCSKKEKDKEGEKEDSKADKETDGSAPGTIRPVDLETRKEAAFQIKEQMTKQGIPLNETAYSALVKILSRTKDVELADSILAEAEGVQQCRVKLRLYSSLLLAYCELGQLLPALKVWERLSKRGLVLTEKEYAALMECCAKVGGASAVMQKVLTDLSEDVLVPAKETCQAIVQWFESPFSSQQQHEQSATKEEKQDKDTKENDKNNDPEDTISSALSRIPLPPNQSHEVESIGPVETSSSGWTISAECKVDTKTGTLLEGCLKRETLQPVQLSQRAWDEMLQMNEKIVVSGKLDQDTSQFQGGGKGRKRQWGAKDQEERKRAWLDFTGYLQHQKELRTRDNHTTTFDVVLDGANIGYCQQNYAGSPKHVDYDQIDSVVQHFQRQRKRVLLVMHQRHFAPNWMPRRFRPLMQSWERAGALCKTPAGMNDDWFWMQAALVSGPGTLVVSNDEMRDHFFQMLAPRSFLRWKERNQVHFHFSGGETPNGQRGSGRKVVLTYPEIYSRRIQRVADGYVIPHPKKGDENRFLDGSHFADEEAAEEETYLCIQPAATTASTSESG